MRAITPDQQLAIAAALDALATKIARVRPMSHTNPNVFYEDRSDVAQEARVIVSWIRSGRKPETSDARPPERAGVR